KIAETTQVDIPEVLVNDELDRMIDDLKFRLSYQGLTLEQYFKYLNTDEAQYRESKKAEAQKTVKIRMTIEEIIKKENLGATQEELKDKCAEHAEKAKKSVDEYMETMTQQQYNYSYNDITMKNP